MFWGTTVDSIVADFQKTIDKLDNLMTFNRRDAEKYAVKIDKLEEKINKADAEFARAQAVVKKLKNLIGE
jgi:peptidoglycan hydrolase CwlO-like protein